MPKRLPRESVNACLAVPIVPAVVEDPALVGHIVPASIGLGIVGALMLLGGGLISGLSLILTPRAV